MHRLSVAIFVVFLLANVSHAAVFYVDPEKGDMSGDGSAGRPWKTVQEVIENKLIQTRDKNGQLKNPDGPAKAGDTILLRSGYHGEIYCRGAYNDDYITIAAEDGHTPKVRRVFFAAAGKWIIRGLTVCPEFAPEFKRDRLIYVVDWGGPSSDFVIEDNTLYSTTDGSSWSAEQRFYHRGQHALLYSRRLFVVRRAVERERLLRHHSHRREDQDSQQYSQVRQSRHRYVRR